MKAIILKEFGEIENLIPATVATPEIQENEVLIKVAAIGINPVDVKTRKGEAQARFIRHDHPMILGWDVSGLIVKVGREVTGYKEGDEVFGMVNFPGHGKAYAEYVAAPASQLALKPANITHEEAVAACLAALTAWKALVNLGKVKEGDRVLIHGASGGVGNYAVQIAKYFGAYVIGTASGANRGFVTRLGVDEFVDYQTRRFEEVARDMDIILDSVGGETFARSVGLLKPAGVIICLPSNKADEVRRIVEEKQVKHFYQMMVESNGENMKSIAAMLHEGRLKSYIFRVYPFDQIPQAQAQVETGKTVGKVVVKIA